MESQVNSDMVLISGTSNEKLAKEIAEKLDVELADQVLTHFNDGEIRYELETPVQGKDVYVIQSTSNPVNESLMELLIILDSLKRSGAGRITAVVPYFGYARQDRQINDQDPITAKLVASMIETAGADRVLTMDIHSDQIGGFFDIPFKSISGREELVNKILENMDDTSNVSIVAPDAGSAKKNRKLADSLNLGFAMTDKLRPRPNVSQVNGVVGEVKGRDLIIIDDMIDTGGTIANVADYLINSENAKSVVVGSTHGVLSESEPKYDEEGKRKPDLIYSPIEKIYVTDTIDIPSEKFSNNSKLQPTVGTADLFAETIENMHKDWV